MVNEGGEPIGSLSFTVEVLEEVSVIQPDVAGHTLRAILAGAS